MEELGLDYKLQPVNIFKGEQKEDWFMKINPNARIPALGELSFSWPFFMLLMLSC